ncbi:MerR family transcriptional regulator [Thermoanaerobacterium sp. CMT5567-10]|uniref:helix-turn-helix domain-containing protein n=1 Tax=Thermoanaerobacterium sp. CMT5567-10 TaxID=3061989 RepID=UPI0026DF6BF0|nr:MerR family transcriptional regulator [Thermoanaerobacterium sp. CMT5567-10]WKV08073.1 MerR family transcriptional regulator [Thermoanaerobacterium sp. CMT5567-10]
MKISEIMKITKLTKKAINYYEEEGLIKPDINPDNNYREYSQNDVDKLIQISTLRQLDVPVVEIKHIISNPDLIRDKLEQHLKRLNDEEKRIEVIRNVIKTCLDGLNQTSDITELTKNMMTLKESLEMDDRAREGFIKRQLLRVFPGNFGKLMVAAYGPFLNEVLDTPEKEKAWLNLVNCLDKADSINYPQEMGEMYEKYTDKDIEKISMIINKTIQEWISDRIEKNYMDRETFLKKLDVIEPLHKEVFNIVKNIKEQLKNSGSDKINEYLSILSSDYRKYKNNLEKFQKSLGINLDENGNIITNLDI